MKNLSVSQVANFIGKKPSRYLHKCPKIATIDSMTDEKNIQPDNMPTDDESVDKIDDMPKSATDEVSENETLSDADMDVSPADDSDAHDEPISGDADVDDYIGGDLDIESALASVANLSAVITDTTEMVQVGQTPKSAPKINPPAFYESDFPHPPLLTLGRGQMPSVIPALALMAIGAGLTFLLISGAESVNMDMVGLLAVGGICLLFLLIWLASGRWARGALFLALITATTAGIIAILPQTPLGASGIPLLLCGWGASVIVSGWLSPKNTAQGFFVGVLLIVIGATGFVFTSGLLPAPIFNIFQQYGLMMVAVAGVLLFIPAIFKRRG